MGKLWGPAAKFRLRERLNWGAVAADAPTSSSGSLDMECPWKVTLSWSKRAGPLFIYTEESLVVSREGARSGQSSLLYTWGGTRVWASVSALQEAEGRGAFRPEAGCGQPPQHPHRPQAGFCAAGCSLCTLHCLVCRGRLACLYFS